MTKFKHTDEQAALWSVYRDRAIEIAMRMAPQTEEDRAACREAVREMYRLAGKEEPRVVFVPSPLMASMVTGCASWIWHVKTNTSLRDDATRAATFAATHAATRAATDAATFAATYNATNAATDAATRDGEVPLSAWYTSPYKVADICRAIAGEGGVKCLPYTFRMRSGGNQWSGSLAMYDWYREVAEIQIDWSKWMPWKALSFHAGPRYMHEKFVVISDFPEILTVDADNRPHNAEGPFCRWRDGFALYAWHGVRVPGWIIEHPERITPELIDAEENAEVRRVMTERYGLLRYLDETGAEVVDTCDDEAGQPMRLLRWTTDDDDGSPALYLHVKNSTADPDGSRREYVLRVDPGCKTAMEARNWTFGLDPDTTMGAVS